MIRYLEGDLFKFRMEHYYDQKQMAELLGVSQPMISKYESGTYNFTIRTLSEIAEKLHLRFDVIFQEESAVVDK